MAGAGGWERRADAVPFTVTGDLRVDVLVPLGDDDLVVLGGTVVALAEATVRVAMDDGPSALTVAISPRAVLLWADDDGDHCVVARPGRRVGDVRSSTTIELVVEDVARDSVHAPRVDRPVGPAG